MMEKKGHNCVLQSDKVVYHSLFAFLRTWGVLHQVTNHKKTERDHRTLQEETYPNRNDHTAHRIRAAGTNSGIKMEVQVASSGGGPAAPVGKEAILATKEKVNFVGTNTIAVDAAVRCPSAPPSG
jgi:hypothetical protein